MSNHLAKALPARCVRPNSPKVVFMGLDSTRSQGLLRDVLTNTNPVSCQTAGLK
jgi:hypothetical protein